MGRLINGVAGWNAWSNNKEHISRGAPYRALLLNIVVTMFDIDDLLIYHPNIILTSNV